MTGKLVVTSAGEGWQVTDTDACLPISWYERIDEAVQEARDYLRFRGGGGLLIHEGSSAVREEVVASI